MSIVTLIVRMPMTAPVSLPWRRSNACAQKDSPVKRVSLLFDHIVPANNGTTADTQHELREFAKSSCMHFSDIGRGICHQLMSQRIVLPGEIVIGADSHSVTLGAFGAFATGVGATDMAAIWLTGETWFRAPESVGIHVTGSFRSCRGKGFGTDLCGKTGHRRCNVSGTGIHW